MTGKTKREEWRQSWPLPMIAMLGIMGPAAYSYSSGVFMGELTRDFGWTKTQFSSALTLQMLLGLIIGPTAAFILDRVGSRRQLLAGIVPFALGLAGLGLANGELWQWWMLIGIYSIAAAGVIPAAWMGGVVRSFDASRGLAMSFCLAGIGISTAVWPMLVAWLVTNIGWRLAFPVMAAGWAIVLLPLTYFWYRPAEQSRTAEERKDMPPIGPAVWTRTFWCLLGAGGIFASVQLALIIHLVPILRLQGLSLTSAAGLAGITGLFSIIGRIGTGTLLDWAPIGPIALFAFLLPIPVMGLLVVADGSVGLLLLAAALLGFAAGSETDVVAYLCSRRFDVRIFGTIYSLFQSGFAICASIGPLMAGWLFDDSGTYMAYYKMAVPMVLVATLLIMLVPAQRSARDQAGALDS